MKPNKLIPAIALIFLPLIAMAQQGDSLAPDGKGLSPGDSLAATTPKVTGNFSSPAMIPKDNDSIGNEEEMDAADGSDFDYQEWLLMWPEQDEGREYDPMDPREDGQAADSRE